MSDKGVAMESKTMKQIAYENAEEAKREGNTDKVVLWGRIWLAFLAVSDFRENETKVFKGMADLENRLDYIGANCKSAEEATYEDVLIAMYG